jgi:hypothetical protein
MVVENLPGNVQQVKQLWISNGVVDILAVLPGGQNVAGPQHSQLLGEIALLYLQASAQIIYAYLASSEFVQDADTKRVCESFEKFGFELAELTHEYSYIIISRESKIEVRRKYRWYMTRAVALVLFVNPLNEEITNLGIGRESRLRRRLRYKR